MSMMNIQPVPQDPSLPPVPPVATWLIEYCECERPIPEERAERRGPAQTYCARCDRELPLRIVTR